MLAAQPAISSAPEGDLQFNDSQWRKWLHLETKNRYVFVFKEEKFADISIGWYTTGSWLIKS